MVPGVASLRCPACGRPFLTLPQQEEARVVCPHCGHSAPALAYAAAGTQPGADLVRSLRERAGLAPPPPEPAARQHHGVWPEAPPLFSAPPLSHAPAREDRPSWPPADPAPAGPETSRFRLADLKTPRPTRNWEEAAIQGRERDLPLGLLLLALALFGLWLLWLSLQPPLAVEIPVPAAVPDQMGLEEPETGPAFDLTQ